MTKNKDKKSNKYKLKMMKYQLKMDQIIKWRGSITSYIKNTMNEKADKVVRFLNKNLVFLQRTMYKFSAYARLERRTLFKKDFGLWKFDWKNSSQS